MPVPSSWNDVTQNVSIKEYIGWVWYDREAWVPTGWKGMTVMLRFESAHYNAIAVSISYCIIISITQACGMCVGLQSVYICFLCSG